EATLRGLTFTTGQDPKEHSAQLLGEITVRDLPGVDAQVTFGGVTVTAGVPPKISVEEISAKLTAGPSLEVRAAFHKIENAEERTLQQRLERFVNDPRGLPHPGDVDSWKPSPPESRDDRGTNWMLVGAGLITLGRADRSEPHPITASILLAVDQQPTLVAAS